MIKLIYLKNRRLRKKQVKKLDKINNIRKIKKRLSIPITILLLIILLGVTNILVINFHYGNSNGPPYCLLCPFISSNLIKPEKGNYIIYKDKENNFSNLFSIISVNVLIPLIPCKISAS